jgi:hypothetical protein
MTFWEFANNSPFTACVLGVIAMVTTLGIATAISVAFVEKGSKKDNE